MKRSMTARLLGTAAAISLCVAEPHMASAETDITTAISTPVATATAANGAPDDIVITASGSIGATGPAAVTLNSNNAVTNAGAINIYDGVNTAGILVLGGTTGSVLTGGGITVSDSTVTPNVIPLTNGLSRFGIEVSGNLPFNGPITQSAGLITVRGNSSAGIWIQPGLNGTVTTAGAISITGNNSFGILAAGPINGALSLSGPISVQGTASVGVSLGQSVSGTIYINSAVTTTGYLNATRPTTTSGFTSLGANDFLQGGSALVAQGNVGGGILIDSAGTVESSSSAPAIVLGSASGPVEIGVASSGGEAYGLVVRGLVRADGVYDTFAATGIQIGVAGGTVKVDGGLKNIGGISATADAANATAIAIQAGSSVPTLLNTGTISASVAGGVFANAATGGNATAISDGSGSLASIQNSGTITTSVNPGLTGTGVSGNTVAFDLRANTTGVTLTQSVGGAILPSITGDILFGSGSAQLNLLGGTLTGAAAFGGAADSLTIANGAAMTGALTESGGKLAVNIGTGRLTMTNAATVSLSSLQVGSNGEVDFAIDPVGGKAARFNVVGATILSTGAKIGLDFNSTLTQAASFTLIQSGTLSAGTLTQPLLLGSIPYFYTGSLVADVADGTVTMNVRPRTGGEIGNTVGASAFNAVLATYGRDAGIRDAFDNASTAGSFRKLYEQMLPDYAGGLFQALSEGMSAVARTEGDSPAALRADRNGYWAVQMGFGATQDGNVAPGYRAGGVGLAFGWETPQRSLGAFGVSATYMIAGVDDRDTGPYNGANSTAYVIGGYWHDKIGGFRADASINGGYAGLTSSRDFNGTDDTGTAFTRTASAHWSGALINGHVGAAYQENFSGFFAGPEAGVDSFSLIEGNHAERNGGNAFDLKINARNGTQEVVEAGLAIGAEFGSKFLWRPEVKVGWQQTVGGPGNTIAQFVSGGPSFALAPEAIKGGPDARLILRGGDTFSDIAFEAGGESRGSYHAFDGKLTARIHL